ncbi:hypothetical protein [uncultured Hymenobacter sp.]|uniref:hypothetical protein n=1 Tax=uncultured Hymenobacter sp. TaxID=170016 RepID=UPI0035CAF026
MNLSDTIISNEFAEPLLGLFDRKHTFADTAVVDFHHTKINLSEYTSKESIQHVLTSLSPAKINLITINTVGANKENILQRFINGYFDNRVELICNSIPKTKRPVYLRWNPEMEVPVVLYPWQYQSSTVYIEAFRRFARLSKDFAPHVKIVWGPAGYPGTEEYWPGGDVVDLISVTINSKSELQATGYPRTKDMTTLLKRKIHRTRFMDKPVLLLGSENKNINTLAKEFLPVATNKIEKETQTIYTTLGAAPQASTLVPNRAGTPIVGVFDPKQLLLASKPVRVEHLFVSLGDIQDGTFSESFRAVTARNHDVILTVELWKDKKVRKDSSVLSNTLNGIYDEEFRAIYKEIITTDQTIYVRFGHEMEIPIHRYPWQSQDPVLYIKAFRYFMNFYPKSLKNIKRIWGPAGDRGAVEWWPGSDVVDIVSVAIYGLPDKNITDPAKQESFATIYTRKHHRMQFAAKPIFITEVGVKGPADFQKKWLENAANVINNHKEIIGVCYFNLMDNPKAWGNIPAPDWSINKDTFISFTDKLASSQ